MRAENKKEIIDASVSLGVSAGLDTMEMKVSPGSINVGAKVSYELQESKENALNILENTKEVYNEVENVSIRGLKTKDSTIEGSIKNLNVEEVKDEKSRNKVGLGFDVSIAFTGTPTGGNGELEFVDKREEKVHKRDIDLSKLEIEKITLKEEKANNHNIDYGLKVGTSGVSARVGEYGLDLNLNVLEAIVNPNEFKDKQELALKDLESSYKGIRSSIENMNKSTRDELTDIADEERRSLKELSNYHLNGEYIVRSLNEKSATTKEDRLSLVRDVDFKDLKVFDKITEENVELLPEDLKRRYYEARERGEELRVIVDQEKNVYTFGDMSELEFKKGLARELGIHLEGRKTEDGKLLGVAAGNIYSDYVLNGSKEITNLEKDNLLDIPRDAKVVSDRLSSVNALMSNGESSRIKEQNDNIGRKLKQKNMTKEQKQEDDKKIFEKEFLSRLSKETIKEYNKLSEEMKKDLTNKIVTYYYNGIDQYNKIKDFKIEQEVNKIIKDPGYRPAAVFEYGLKADELKGLAETYVYDMILDDGSDNPKKEPRNEVKEIDVKNLKTYVYKNGEIRTINQKLILGDTLTINDKKLIVVSIENKVNGYQGVVLKDAVNKDVFYVIPKGTNQKRDWLTNVFALPYRNKLTFLDQTKDALEQIEPFKDKTLLGAGHSLGGAILTTVSNKHKNISAVLFDPASNNTETNEIGSRSITIKPKGEGILELPNSFINFSKDTEDLNQKVPLYMYDYSQRDIIIKEEMKIIEELNKENIIYINSTNERIENKEKYDEIYKKFEKEYLKKESQSLFKDVMSYSESYEDQKAQVLVENIDEILKDDVKKDKKMIEDELLKMIKMRRGKLREHNSGKLDDKLNNILIKPNEYERIGR